MASGGASSPSLASKVPGEGAGSLASAGDAPGGRASGTPAAPALVTPRYLQPSRERVLF